MPVMLELLTVLGSVIGRGGAVVLVDLDQELLWCGGARKPLEALSSSPVQTPAAGPAQELELVLVASFRLQSCDSPPVPGVVHVLPVAVCYLLPSCAALPWAGELAAP